MADVQVTARELHAAADRADAAARLLRQVAASPAGPAVAAALPGSASAAEATALGAAWERRERAAAQELAAYAADLRASADTYTAADQAAAQRIGVGPW
ncbi:MAG: hypothetical protein ACLGIV_13235 [Actinomycetes bacterium]